MKIGIFAKTFNRPTIEELFQGIASYGIYSVQFNMSCAGLETFPGTRPRSCQITIRPVLAWRKDRSKAQPAIAATCTRPGASSPHPRRNCLLPSGKV
jgi:hypothetical protein